MEHIDSEEPVIHWRFLDVKDKVVLDLGCGKFYSSISTAEWFLQQGAKDVIGIDLSDINLNNEKFTMVVARIVSPDQLALLIHSCPIDVIKCDIEGAEINFNSIKTLPECIKQFAVEYHDNETKLVCERAIIRWGFKNMEYYQLFNEDINRIGVIYAWN